MKQRNASSGVHTIGSPRTLKLVLTITGQPVRNIQLVDPEQPVLLLGHRDTVRSGYVSDEQHIRAIHVEIEPPGRVLAENGGSERTKGFPILDLEIEHLLHGRRARVAQDRAGTERAWAKFHPSLEPAECFPLRQRSRGGVKQRFVVDDLENRACLAEARLDVGLRVFGSEVSPTHSIEGA